MSSHNHHYRDTDFNPEHSAGYTLLIRIGSVSFSYAVVGQNKLLALGENIDIHELKEPSGENIILIATYKERILSLSDNGFTLVPVTLFRSDLTPDFARFLDVKDDEKVFSQPLDAENKVVYKVEKGSTTVADKLGQVNIVFGAKGWITVVAANNPSHENLYINIEDDKVELLNFRDNKLRFYNHFEFKNEDELVYFTSLVAEELELQHQTITLYLSGDIETSDQNFNRLSEFFLKVKLNNLQPVELPGEVPSHVVLTLTALNLCGSSAAN